MKSQSSVLLAIVCMGLFAACALADKHVVESIRVVEAPDGSGLTTGRIETWIGMQRYTRVDGLNGITTIVRRDLDKMYVVIHENREVIEIDLPFVLPDYLQPLFDEVTMHWELNRLPEQRRIGQWDCTKVLVSGRGTINVDVELWVADKTGIDTRTFQTMVGDALSASALYREMGEKLNSIAPNFAIRTVTTIEQLGLRTSTEAEVQSIVEDTAPAGIYDPPEDYTIRTLDFSTYLSLVRQRQPAPGGR